MTPTVTQVKVVAIELDRRACANQLSDMSFPPSFSRMVLETVRNYENPNQLMTAHVLYAESADLILPLGIVSRYYPYQYDARIAVVKNQNLPYYAHAYLPSADLILPLGIVSRYYPYQYDARIAVVKNQNLPYYAHAYLPSADRYPDAAMCIFQGSHDTLEAATLSIQERWLLIQQSMSMVTIQPLETPHV
jgi:hypothetical protein